MRFQTAVPLLLLLAFVACGGNDGVAPSPTGASPGGTASRTPEEGPGLDLSETPKAEGAAVEMSDGRIVTRLPASGCIETTATPLVIGEYAVFATHKKTAERDDPYSDANGCRDDTTKPGLYAVSLVSGEAYTLMEANAEATATYVDGTIILPMLGNGNVAFWKDGEVEIVDVLSAGIDSAGVWDQRESVFVVGSVNSPSRQCQAPVNDDCGAVIAVTEGGALRRRLDRADGFRAWVTAGVTTNGRRYFIGTGAGIEGDAVPVTTPECQVLALSRQLEVEAAYDDGIYQCTSIGGLESAVVGEMPIAGDGMWVQYVGSTNEGPFTPVVQLTVRDLHVTCRAEIPAVPWQATALYYQAPVIDAEGNAWVVTATSENGMNASIIRVGADCGRRILVNTTEARASTPTLADDKYILASWDGKLHVIDRVTGEMTDYQLGEWEPVIGGAVISDYGVTVVGESGTVTTFTDTGIKGYGSDPWPRFRKDNYGRATAP